MEDTVRLIDGNRLAELFEGAAEKGAGVLATVYRDAAHFARTAPTVEPEVRHGMWIDTPLPNSRVAKCSLCGFWQRTNGDDKTGKHSIHSAVYRYCAGCGARMDGGTDDAGHCGAMMDGGTISRERFAKIMGEDEQA